MRNSAADSFEMLKAPINQWAEQLKDQFARI